MNAILRPLAALAVAALSSLPSAAWAAQPLEVTFLSVGQGDAAFAVTPSGRTLLVDAGPPESAAALERFLLSRLRGPIDAVVATHPHADHIGGLPAALSIAGARHFYDPVLDHPSPLLDRVYRIVSQRTRAGEMTAHRVRAGETAPLELGDGVRLTFLAPSEPLIERSRSDVNANSIVFRLDYRQVSFLFEGDAEPATEERLLRGGRGRLRARVLKVAHHGSRYGSKAALLRAVGPEYAVVSCGEGNSYGHPHAATVRRLERAGARVFRTDRDGDVVVRTDGRSVEMTTVRR
ncbi:MAG TPA: ComEC/Rec2 family competence protein [Anaeromyxobacteraceae bacterium]|nr:ComEC/Rec2 family competence protein [Anaeromyxobacteraceae bacterium]